jgi:hypothetical protein
MQPRIEETFLRSELVGGCAFLSLPSNGCFTRRDLCPVRTTKRPKNMRAARDCMVQQEVPLDHISASDFAAMLGASHEYARRLGYASNARKEVLHPRRCAHRHM